MAEETSRDAFAFVRENMGKTQFHKWLLPELVAVDEENSTVTVRLQLRGDLCHRPTEPFAVHGGVLAALVDITGHAAVASKVFRSSATIDLRTNYLRVASGSALTAVGTVVKLGRTVSFTDIKITDDKGQTVVTGQATYLTQAPEGAAK